MTPSVTVWDELPSFRITPADSFYNQRSLGLIDPSRTRNYTLLNNGTSDLNWTAGETASWFDLSSYGGTIPAGGSATVTVSLNSEVRNLQTAGIHRDVITFTDTTNNITLLRDVEYEIKIEDALRLHVKLDETSGYETQDSSVYSNYAKLRNTSFSSASVEGRFGRAVTFDGVNDFVLTSGADFKSNTATITAWVKPDGTQLPYAGIVSNRDGSAGNLNYKDNNHLGYHWPGGSYAWDSGLTTPDGVWTFVALVVRPTKATIYTYDGSTLDFSVYTSSHGACSFYGTPSIGRDDYVKNTARFYKGAIDDVRIYNIALDTDQLLEIADGGRAVAPQPFDGFEGILTSSTTLRWDMAPCATANDVYWGTSYNNVLNANTNSTEYKGRQTENTYPIDGLQQNTDYFWRIDSVTSSGTIIPSDIWRFSTGAKLGSIGRQVWENIGSGTSVSYLTSNSNYPDNPDINETLFAFESPKNWGSQLRRTSPRICRTANDRQLHLLDCQ